MEPIFKYHCYREFIKVRISELKVKSPGYSLRALAQSSKISPAFLSLVLAHKKNLSLNTGESLAEKLKLQGTAKDYFRLLVQMDHVSSEDQKKTITAKLQVMARAALAEVQNEDSFKFLTHWYVTAVLELVSIRKISTPQDVIRFIRISEEEAQDALLNLEKLQVISKNSLGQYARVKGQILWNFENPNHHIRAFYKSMMRLSANILDEQDPKDRCFGYETLALDPTLLPELRNLQEDFFSRLYELQARSSQTQEQQVYYVSLQAFRLTEVKSRKARIA